MTSLKANKYERITQEQIQHYVGFCKVHPELAAQPEKNAPPMAHSTRILWAQMAKELNEIRGPTRTTSEWRTSLLNAKYVRAYALKEMEATTSAAEVRQETPPVNAFQEEAVEAFDGPVAVDVIESGMTLGLNNMQETNNVEMVQEDSVLSSASLIAVPSPANFVTLAPSSDAMSDQICNSGRCVNVGQFLEVTMSTLEAQRVREETILASHMALQEILGRVATALINLTESMENNIVNK